MICTFVFISKRIRPEFCSTLLIFESIYVMKVTSVTCVCLNTFQCELHRKSSKTKRRPINIIYKTVTSSVNSNKASHSYT